MSFRITLSLPGTGHTRDFHNVPDGDWETKQNPENPPEIDFKTASGKRVVSNWDYLIQEEPVDEPDAAEDEPHDPA